ncbi:MAG: hypothetical protein E6973_22725, partial [Enterobacter hormaechei]|nr:hypothetical protein [Enterobacter hormaechei]
NIARPASPVMELQAKTTPRKCDNPVPASPQARRPQRRFCRPSGFAEQQIRSAIAGPHRSLDRRRQAGIGPVPGQSEVGKTGFDARPQRVLFRITLQSTASNLPRFL